MKNRPNYHDSSVDELKVKQADLRKELFNLRFQNATGEIENPMRIQKVKKDIARILTIIKEKENKAK